MEKVVQIGKCMGCMATARLDDGVCKGCLEHPKRGRKWAEMSHRIRHDLAFALEAFNNIGVRKPENELAGKLLFIRMYGVPEGAVLSPELKRLVDSSDFPSEDEDPHPYLRLVQ